jgi:6,7-dimethyl-8-ribityllumazine synthase
MKQGEFIGIAVSRFNEEITERLLASCLKTLASHGYGPSAVRLLRVPGGFELPWAAWRLAKKRGCQAVIALGCILKGSTPQNDHIARSVVQHLHDVCLSTEVPVLLGVITPNTYSQALARCRGRLDRGREAAQAAVEIIKAAEAL